MAKYGFRGYVASRPVRGASFPQTVQNLVVRDYASRKGLRYILSKTEYAMPSCFLMLDDLLEEATTLEGIVAFSIFMLPQKRARRREVYERLLSSGCELHAALENLAVRSHADLDRVEALLDVAFTLPALPLGGRYEKEETSARDRMRDPFWCALHDSLASGVGAPSLTS